jgi:S1-C subfamily serine protease
MSSSIPRVPFFPILRMSTTPASSPSPPPSASYSRPVPPLIWVLVTLLAIWLMPTITEQVQYGLERGRERARADVARTELKEHNLDSLSRASTEIAKVIAPSVVHIQTTRLRQRLPDEFSRMFGNLRPQLEQVSGQGSGVVIDRDGYILTNNHVVENAQQIEVWFGEKRFLPAELIGVDQLTDLAVIKVSEPGVEPAEWGDSDQLEVGALVWAAGNPFGLDRSITMGIISAKDRHLSDNGRTGNIYHHFLQSDVAINPGNSGGPLVDTHGKVVGINTAIIGQSYSGVSFSIPSNMAKDVFERLKSNGHVVRGWLAVDPVDLAPDVARALKLPADMVGALLRDVVSNGPAEKSGLKPLDLIVRWDGHPVDSADALRILIAESKVGEQVAVTIIRDGKPLELHVVVGERPPETRH